ncbi:LysR family transcriptional regulator [Pararobbsia silviterrae]|uniref:LysR family transcriptional regulator n=1 Tax=Pararobbsia silviterrae TaxID=1792498 RepID=A0A494Y1D0_9BURK|nr:LysR family transcriptional regulator [Pararobbsia silviterrae]
MNYKHLYYFWMVARIGGVVRASHRLHITPQTLSGQIKLLEQRFGGALFVREGRHIRLTEAGRIAADYADDIFAKGLELDAAVRESLRATHALSRPPSSSPLRPQSHPVAHPDAAPLMRPLSNDATRTPGFGHLTLVSRRD